MSYPTNQLAIQLDEMWSGETDEWEIQTQILWLDRVNGVGALVVVPRLTWCVNLHSTTDIADADWVKRTWSFYDGELEVALLHAVEFAKTLVALALVNASS
jgi:hypothetical protein